MAQARTAEARKMNGPRLIALLIALIGCVVVAVPKVYPLADPIPIVLIGCGVTTFALALFLFFSV